MTYDISDLCLAQWANEIFLPFVDQYPLIGQAAPIGEDSRSESSQKDSIFCKNEYGVAVAHS